MSAPELLRHVTSPGDLKVLPATALPELAEQIRRRLIDVVTRTGGHLGPNLGVVELTIALHREFDAPNDAIVWMSCGPPADWPAIRAVPRAITTSSRTPTPQRLCRMPTASPEVTS
jgi:hypothetical protein